MSPQAKKEETLADKYAKALEELQNSEESQLAIVIKQETVSQTLTIKHRLLLRKAKNGIIHTWEIVEPETNATIQIPLLGNWHEIINAVLNIIESIDMSSLKEVGEELKSLRPQRRKKEIREVE